MSSEDKILDMVRDQPWRTNPASAEAPYSRAAGIDDSIRYFNLNPPGREG